MFALMGAPTLRNTGSTSDDGEEDEPRVFVMTDDEGDGVAGDDGEYLETYTYG